MSREIKFRAWIQYPDNHTYCDDDCSSEIGPALFYQQDQYLGSFLRRANFMASSKEHDSYAEGKLEMMQYIGLKDKNGVEVYEGDIVRWGGHCEYCRERPIRVATVRLDPDLFFESQVGVFHYGSFIYTAKADTNTLEHLEVIGNIYENPELLDGR